MTGFHPLQVKATTGEPYLRLPAPHANIIITPLRVSDKPALIAALNDPRVYSQLSSIPFPYTQADADWWLSFVDPEAQLRRFRAIEDGDTSLVGECPVRTLREVGADGSETFLGDIMIGRSKFMEADEGERESATKENDAKELGDPTIVWSIGDYLVPSHQGKGIMTAAIRALIHEWAIPRMGVRLILINAFLGNTGSVRVFEKNGFILTGEKQNHIQARGQTHGIHIMKWKANEQDD